jgi:RNA polymerase sigma factor (sigma-70 family)
MDDLSNLSQHLLKQWEAGEQDAATKIFERYVDRLVRLVSPRLASNLQARFGPEDVVQSAFREFFDKAKRHEVVLKRSGDLWSLLAAITLNKLRGQIERHKSAGRDPNREHPPAPPDLSDALGFIDREPDPAEAAVLLDELDRFLKNLRPKAREVFVFRLQGQTVEDIARRVDRCEAVVQQIVREAKKQLIDQLVAPS